MSSPAQAASPGSNGLALVSFTAGLVPPLAFALGWLITYSPLTLQADPGLLGILEIALVVVGVIAAQSALVVGIIALVMAGRYPRGRSHIGFAIAGVVLAALDGLGILLLLIATGLALFAMFTG
jgi:hypothetical protein